MFLLLLGVFQLFIVPLYFLRAIAACLSVSECYYRNEFCFFIGVGRFRKWGGGKGGAKFPAGTRRRNDVDAT